MTNEDAIKTQVQKLREYYYIGKYPNEVDAKCNECELENRAFADRNNLGYEQINLNHLGIKEPFHKASLIGFNTENGPKWYLVDPTYGQFFKNEDFKNYMLNNHEEFSLTLLEHGYIECTLLNILYYINGFTLSNAFEPNININEVYNKVEQLLLSNNIVNKEINSYYNKLIELLYLRKELLEQSNTQKETKKLV